ncbi:ATP-dependent nuclease [Azospirillum sp. sgz302134]
MSSDTVLLPVSRLRLFGLRKLNWQQRGWTTSLEDHLSINGLDRWLELRRITIIVGPNGGGKSTVIDLLRALAEPGCWPSLPRENYPGEDCSGFDVEGPGWSVQVRFSKRTPDADQMFTLNAAELFGRRGPIAIHGQEMIPKLPVTGTWTDTIQSFLEHTAALRVHYFPATGRRPGEELDDAQLVGVLNELSPHLPSVYHNPQMSVFKLFQGATPEPGNIGVYFKDDPGQHAFVHRDALPLGWLQLASVLAFLRGCEAGSLVLLDEPDRHLHPSLQRVMLDLVDHEGCQRGFQTVLATHSPVLTNPELCDRVHAQVLVAARGRCEPLSDRRRLLDDLGVTSGDLVQANGIIWVEGPTDRIYLKTWIEQRARQRGLPVPIERMHYQIATFGGALLKHVTLVEEENDRIALPAINRNFTVVIDRDIPTNAGGIPEAEKRRLVAEAEGMGRPDVVWITDRYTIEDYLPPAITRGCLRHENGRTRVVGMSKMDLAYRFRLEAVDWDSGVVPGTDLPDRIDRLLVSIVDWQTPQEVIHPPYVPPWLNGERL